MENIDLHVHSNNSDGVFDYFDLIYLFLHNNIHKVSICDHDKIFDVNTYLPIFLYYGIELISGIEFNTNINKMHLLGYGILNQQRIVDYINDYKNINLDVCKNVIELLKYKGNIDISYEKVVEYIERKENIKKIKLQKEINSNPYFQLLFQRINFKSNNENNDILCKRDIANYLIEIGVSSSTKEVYNSLIGANDPYYIPIVKPKYEEIIDIIISSGGVPVLAHPMSLMYNDEDIEKLIKRLKDIGLEGIEIYGNRMDYNKIGFYSNLVKKYELISTGGSDFHKNSKMGVECDESVWNNLEEKILLSRKRVI